VAGDSGSVVQFEIKTPLDGAAIRTHIQSALSRGLDEVEIAAPREQRLAIVANGPSALNAPLHAPLNGSSVEEPTLAMNNALHLFVDRGIAPDYWMASDPQACVADYLRDAPRDTVYLVASKCHPAVFDALRDRRVVLWHCAEPGTLDLLTGRLVIQSSITVTLCALNLMPVLGYQRLATWGWDGCYLSDRDHAATQPHHRGGDITIEVMPGQQFTTTPSWAAEAQEAVRLFQSVPRDVTVHGGGMIAAILDRFGFGRADADGDAPAKANANADAAESRST
jgi:hypothetical protein